MEKFEKGKVFAANNVIDYAEGGVVSKEFVHNAAGSVTVFSFDKGQGLSEHTAPFDALIQVIDGTMQLNVEVPTTKSTRARALLSPLVRAIRCKPTSVLKCSSR